LQTANVQKNWKKIDDKNSYWNYALVSACKGISLSLKLMKASWQAALAQVA